MSEMDLRSILSGSKGGIFDLIETAIRVAASDYGDELRSRRDKIVEALYAPSTQVCRNCDYPPQDKTHCYNHVGNGSKQNNSFERCEVDDAGDDSGRSRNVSQDFGKSALTPESNNRNYSGGNEEDDEDPFENLFDDEQTEILNIKEQLEDPLKSEEAVVEMLQNLADMDINFQALQETDIGRHVNQLRKHPSSEVRILVKQLVRKWKETVDQWVKVNANLPRENANIIVDEDSPEQNIQKNQQNGRHQIPDFGYSTNSHNGNSYVEKHNAEHERKPRVRQTPPSAQQRETSSTPPQSAPKAVSAPPSSRDQKNLLIDDERLNSARRRLQENYQEAENAKKQRTVQMMDIREIPKPRNAFFKNKGGFHGRQHR